MAYLAISIIEVTFISRPRVQASLEVVTAVPVAPPMPTLLTRMSRRE